MGRNFRRLDAATHGLGSAQNRVNPFQRPGDWFPPFGPGPGYSLQSWRLARPPGLAAEERTLRLRNKGRNARIKPPFGCRTRRQATVLMCHAHIENATAARNVLQAAECEV